MKSLPLLRDGTPVAAWLFKANPLVWDVLDALRSGAGIDTWRMTPSYRTALLAPGQACVLWITRDPAVPATPGVFAIGTLTTATFDDMGDPDDPRWFDRAAAREVRPHVGTELAVLEVPIPASELREDPRWNAEEVFRAPRMGSPLAVTPEAWSALLERR